MMHPHSVVYGDQLQLRLYIAKNTETTAMIIFLSYYQYFEGFSGCGSGLLGT
jgi:hypothetical protein